MPLQEDPTDGAGPAVGSFRLPGVNLLLGAKLFSLIGDHLYLVALPWLVLEASGSTLLLGAVFATAAVPRALLMPFAGAWTDQHGPGTVMLTATVVRGATLTALLLVIHSDMLALSFPLAAALGAASAFYYPAESSVIARLVSSSQIPAATALSQSANHLLSILGPAVAGAAVAFIGGEAALGLGAIAYAVAVPWLMMMRPHLRQVAVVPEPYLAAMMRGLAAVWSDPVLKRLVAASAITNLGFLGPFLVGLPAFVQRVLFGDASLFGVLLAAFGAGSLLGAIMAGRIGRGHEGLTTGVGLAVAAAAFGLVSAADSLGWSLGLLAVAGMGSGLANVKLTALLQLRSDPSMVGRVMSLLLFGSFALAPISQAGAGIVVQTIGPGLVFLIGAGISLVGIAVAAPALRRADAA